MGDNDFPVISPGSQFLQQFLEKKSYGQTGTNIPTYTLSKQAEGGSGTGVKPYYAEEISASPSFEVQPVDIDSSTIDDWLNKGLRSQPGYKPPSISLPQLQRNIQRVRASLRSA